VWTLARHEWKRAATGAVLAWFTVIFFLLAVLTLYFGVQAYGDISFQALNKTTSSLLQLAFYFIPVATLLLSSMSVAGEWEDGTALLLWQTVKPVSILAGKWLGLTLAMMISVCLGFGFAGLVSAVRGLASGWVFFVFIGVLLLLSMIFLAIGLAVGAWCKDRLTAVLVSLFIWFFAIVIYPFCSMALFITVPSVLHVPLAIGLQMFNPADFLRVYAAFKIGGEAVFGSHFYALGQWSKTGWMDATVLAWSAVWVGIGLWWAVLGWKRRGK